VPQAFTLSLVGQVPAHAWVPLGHCPSHEAVPSTQRPLQSFLPDGHEPPQWMPSQVAVPSGI